MVYFLLSSSIYIHYLSYCQIVYYPLIDIYLIDIYQFIFNNNFNLLRTYIILVKHNMELQICDFRNSKFQGEAVNK